MHSKIIILVAVALLFFGCNTTNSVYEEKLQKDQFLEQNFSAEQPAASQTKPALKTDYYNEIVAGKVVVGMSLLEAKLATKTFPHGPNRYNTVFWCDTKVVDRCNENCQQCAATLLTPDYTHYMQGKGDKLVVVKSLARHVGDDVYSLKTKPYPVVNALFLNRIVTGMSIEDFNRIEQLPNTKIQYFCKEQRVFESCLLDCSDCTLKLISPRGNLYHVQTVRFRGHNDYATVVNVQESTFARNQ